MKGIGAGSLPSSLRKGNKRVKESDQGLKGLNCQDKKTNGTKKCPKS